MKTIVSERGRITIPKPLRVRMGIRSGQSLEIKENRGRLVMTKHVPRDAFDKYFGILKLGRSTDEIMKELRGEFPPKSKPYRLRLHGWKATAQPGVDLLDRDTLSDHIGRR